MLVQHEGVRLELKLRRGQWAVFGWLFLVLGVAFAVAAPLFLLVAVVDRNAGALVGVIFGGVFGSVSVLAGISAWRISRSHPAIVVGEDRLTIEHPGVFVRPLPLSRSAVHSGLRAPLSRDGPPSEI